MTEFKVGEPVMLTVSEVPKLTKNGQRLYVIKRDGRREAVSFDKITQRLERLCDGLPSVDPTLIARTVSQGIYPGVRTTELDDLATDTAAYMATTHPEYPKLAGRIMVSNLHRHTPATFSEAMSLLFHYQHPRLKRATPLLSEEFYSTVVEHKEFLDGLVRHERDYQLDFFAFKTFSDSYLKKADKTVVERPQYLHLRVATFLHPEDMEKVRQTYEALSKQLYTHASPTMFNAGAPHPKLSSCVQLCIQNDSIVGIYKTLQDIAVLSKGAAGIGVSIQDVRGAGSYIVGTNGRSNGIVPMLQVMNATARYVDQCFDGSTLVCTLEQGWCPIIEAHTNLRVLGADGVFHRITQVRRTPYNGDVVFLKLNLLPDTVVSTPEHPYLTLVNHSSAEPTPASELTATDVRRLHANGRVGANYVDVCQLKRGDWVGYPVPQESRVPDGWTAEDSYFLGAVIGDGAESSKYEVVMNLDSEEVERKVISYLRDRMVPLRPMRADQEGRFAFSWNERLPFYDTDIQVADADYGSRTRCPPWALSLPGELLRPLLEAWYREGLADTMLRRHLGVEAESTADAKTGLDRVDAKAGLDPYDQTREEFLAGRVWAIDQDLVHDVLGICVKMGFLPRITRVDGLTLVHFPRGVKEYLLGETELLEVVDEDVVRVGSVLFTRVETLELVQGVLPTRIMVDLNVEDEPSFTVASGVVHNGGGQRKGAIAAYLEPWHPDIFEFLELKKNHGIDDRARDLFYALWTPDLFMERVEHDKDWSLFCSSECPGLADAYGPAFKELYERYEAEGRAVRVIKARDLWRCILVSQMETGTPYMHYKDAVNLKSMQKHLGTIRGSNLCSETSMYHDANEIPPCNLASIALPKFVNREERTFDLEGLRVLAELVVENLNRVVDLAHFDLPETQVANRRHRNVGLGVQGLSDVFNMLEFGYDDPEAQQLNRDIFETLYFAAVTVSCRLAERDGPHESYPGSPASQGLLNYDLWGVVPSGRYDWAGVKARIARFGLRNCLLLAPMPTASTSQMMSNTESFEPLTSNIYIRRTKAGEFAVINENLVKALQRLGLWTDSVRTSLLAEKGSIQQIKELPEKLRHVYRTVWELSMVPQINMSADRGAFIDQSQSFNAHMATLNHPKLTTYHFYCWKKGLKTGMYYLRTKAAMEAVAIEVLNKQVPGSVAVPVAKSEPEPVPESVVTAPYEGGVCSMVEGCISCGS